MRNLLLIIFIGVILFSCKKDSEDYVQPDIGQGYAGMELGKYVVYDVDSFFYDDFTATIDTSMFKIKEVVAESYIDLEGEEAFKINRYKKDNDTTSWLLKDVWSAKLTSTNFQKTEENVRFVKLVFPVREGAMWNGNSMNNLSSREYEFLSIDASESIGGNSLKKVLTVNQLENLNLIEQQQFLEKYAKSVGLVYKRNMDLVRDNLSSPWRGYDVTYTLSSFGG
ncbi:MAG: hypothetical protein P1U41_09590 [Vicingaceae bacterium]|nr:hypothetical protein [Vicingaceae bacterium]